jgi:hypothetical protein
MADLREWLNMSGALQAVFQNLRSFTLPLVGFSGIFAPQRLANGGYYFQMGGAVANSSGKFVAVGYGSPSYPQYATSTDGTTWTAPATMNGSTTVAYMRGVTVNSSGLFVAVGENGSNYPVFATSTDGSTWTTPATMNGSTTVAYMRGVTVNSSGLFVAVGVNASNYPVYATSTDGSTWTTPATMNGSTTFANMWGVAVNSSGLFAAVGYNSTDHGVAAYSSDGSTWTTPALMDGISTLFIVSASQCITVNSSGLFVAVGSGTSSAPRAAYSSNGTSWSTPAAMNGSTTPATMTGVVYNETTGVFVAVGYGKAVVDGFQYGQNNNAVYATSSNGSTWTTPTLTNGVITPSTVRAVAIDYTGKVVTLGAGYGNSTCIGAAVAAYSFATTGGNGQSAFLATGTYTWVAPAGVTSVSAVALGHGGSGGNISCTYTPIPGPCCTCCGYVTYIGGGGGGGGGIAWANNQTVTPGGSYTVTVRLACAGAGNTSFSTFAVAGGGANASYASGGAGGTVITGTGYSGGAGGSATSSTSRGVGGGGGGAAGYLTSGGAGGAAVSTNGQSKTGAAGGGASGENANTNSGGSGGGGSFIMGTQTPYCNSTGTGGVAGTCFYNSAKGVYGYSILTSAGDGNGGSRLCPQGTKGGPGGNLGGGGGGGSFNPSRSGGPCIGKPGAVRVIWPGCARSYPSTNVRDL